MLEQPYNITNTDLYNYYYKKLPSSIKRDLDLLDNVINANIQRINAEIMNHNHKNAITNKSPCIIFNKHYSIWKLYIARKSEPNPKKGFRIFVANVLEEKTWYLHIIYIKNEYEKIKANVDKEVEEIKNFYRTQFENKI